MVLDMKLKDLEKIYKMSENIPKNFSLKVKEKILRNKFLIRSELEFLQELIKSSEPSNELNEYFNREYSKSSEILFINIVELPDDINELDAEFLEGLFLITN